MSDDEKIREIVDFWLSQDFLKKYAEIGEREWQEMKRLKGAEGGDK